MRKTEAKEQSLRAGQKIILTGWIGLDGMLCVLEKKREELEQKFAPAFLMQAKARGEERDIHSEEEIEEITDAFVYPDVYKRQSLKRLKKRRAPADAGILSHLSWKLRMTLPIKPAI